jgi:hypothetical protein
MGTCSVEDVIPFSGPRKAIQFTSDYWIFAGVSRTGTSSSGMPISAYPSASPFRSKSDGRPLLPKTHRPRSAGPELQQERNRHLCRNARPSRWSLISLNVCGPAWDRSSMRFKPLCGLGTFLLHLLVLGRIEPRLRVVHCIRRCLGAVQGELKNDDTIGIARDSPGHDCVSVQPLDLAHLLPASGCVQTGRQLRG